MQSEIEFAYFAAIDDFTDGFFRYSTVCAFSYLLSSWLLRLLKRPWSVRW